jgi:hypothetical protein
MGMPRWLLITVIPGAAGIRPNRRRLLSLGAIDLKRPGAIAAARRQPREASKAPRLRDLFRSAIAVAANPEVQHHL